MRRVIAKDPNGVPRCWGEGDDWNVALDECVAACNEYLTGGRLDIPELHVFMDGERVITVHREQGVIAPAAS